MSSAKKHATIMLPVAKKYSYKSPSYRSSVVICREGHVMEVRRNYKTRWYPEEERRAWPSLPAWLLTLPAYTVFDVDGVNIDWKERPSVKGGCCGLCRKCLDADKGYNPAAAVATDSV
jgi:hypothetical protein